MDSSRSLSVRSHVKRNDRDNLKKNTQSIKCHKCFDFGQIQVVCPNCLWSKSKTIKAPLKDESYIGDSPIENRTFMVSIASLSDRGSSVNDIRDLGESSLDDSDVEEEALLAKKFKKFLKFNKGTFIVGLHRSSPCKGVVYVV
jgi:hypothetical protein